MNIRLLGSAVLSISVTGFVFGSALVITEKNVHIVNLAPFSVYFLDYRGGTPPTLTGLVAGEGLHLGLNAKAVRTSLVFYSVLVAAPIKVTWASQPDDEISLLYDNNQLYAHLRQKRGPTQILTIERLSSAEYAQLLEG